LIDDPIRSRQDADSELIRDRIWDWYINDFKTRLIPHAAEIMIQTRWSEDDLAGRALNHEEWRVISLPALAEPGDPLGRALGEPLWCDDDYGYGGQLVELSTKTPARTWSSMDWPPRCRIYVREDEGRRTSPGGAAKLRIS